MLDEDMDIIQTTSSLLMETLVENIHVDSSSLHLTLNQKKSINLKLCEHIYAFANQIWDLSDEQFQSHFRMSKRTMEILIDTLKEKIPEATREKLQVSFDKRILLTVWLLSNKDPYREAGNLFGLHKSSVAFVFHWTCQLICEL
ncbi:hypothetical protein NQ315_016232, partial [Exocentrus adspersus]